MTSKCVCPDNLEQLIMIEYPGFVKNPDKALSTMGGMESIEKVVESQKDRLELKFRKSDPLSHPAYGDRTSKRCLVLRLHKNKKLASETGEEGESFEISVVGKIQTSYKFDTMAEFQWLPMQRTNLVERDIKPEDLHNGVTIQRSAESLNPQYTSILDDILPLKNPFDNTLKNFNPDAPLLVLPAVFSRFDTPREIHQPHPKFRSKEMRDEFERQQSMAVIGRTRKKRSTMSYLINFGDKIPERPPEKLIKEKSSLSAQERDLVPALERCFERQKIWSKAGLCFELSTTALEIKFIIPLIAYHWLNGPFRTMWVKYGYDPHKDPASKLLQTLDFRVKNPQDQQEYSRRSINSYQLPMRKNTEKLRDKTRLDLRTMISSATSSSSAMSNQYIEAIDDPMFGPKGLAITEAMCKFRRDLVPPARQLSYQLKDIEIDEVQAIVNANDGNEPGECSEKDGWLPEGSIDRIRKIMTKSLQETIGLMTSQLEE